MQTLLKLVISSFFIVTLTQAKIIPKAEESEAKQLLRQKRDFYRRSNAERECFRKTVCEYEEYAESAENTYGEAVIRENFATKFQTAFKNFYTDCHSQNPNCKNKPKKCKCNIAFKAFADDYENAAATKTTTQAPATTVRDEADCGWFCTTQAGDY